MKKAITSLVLFFMGTSAAHLDLDPAMKAEFAQKRIALMKASKATKEKDIEKKEALEKKGSDLERLKKEVAQLQTKIAVAETSTKPLMKM